MMRRPSPVRLLATFAALLALLAASVVLARMHLGPWNPVVAVVIAIAKAALVISVFMRPAEGGPPARFALAFGTIWVIVMLALTLSDFLFREVVSVAG